MLLTTCYLQQCDELRMSGSRWSWAQGSGLRQDCSDQRELPDSAWQRLSGQPAAPPARDPIDAAPVDAGKVITVYRRPLF